MTARAYVTQLLRHEVVDPATPWHAEWPYPDPRMSGRTNWECADFAMATALANTGRGPLSASTSPDDAA